MKIELYADDMLKQFPKGVFLTVKDDNKINTMTIGWGSIGIVWGKPTFVAMIRPSRYTYELLEKTGEFTISVPKFNTMKKELIFCGKKSGRDFDKIKECNLEISEGKEMDVPTINGCEIFYECKVVYKEELKSDRMPQKLMSDYYSSDDIHTMYYGQIVTSYRG